MFEKYMIVETDVENVVEDGKITGFRFGTRLPYYRGLGLSMVEEIIVTLDDEPIPQDQITLTLHGNTYTMAQMEVEPDDRWNMGEVAHITVPKAGGLTAGEHNLGLLFNLRIGYMPFPSIRRAEKIITIG